MPLQPCRIIGRFMSTSDDEPGLFPIRGLQVEIRPNLSHEALKQVSTSAGLVPVNVQATTDDLGRLVTRRGSGPVWIAPSNNPDITPTDFTYRVTITDARGQRISDFHIKAPAGGVVDLVNTMPVTPSTGTSSSDFEAVEQRVILLSNAVVAAHNAALSAAERAEAAVAELDDTPSFILYFENGLV